MHKFILGENPQAPNTGGLWIIHLPDPQSIIEVVHLGQKTHSKKASIVVDYNYNGEVIQLRLHHCFTTNFTAAEDYATKLMDNAWHWYVSYMKWEDGNIEIDENAQFN